MTLQARLEANTARIATEIKAVKVAIADRATLAQVDARIATVVGAAPAALDTLQEIAAALSQNESATDGLVQGILATQSSLVALRADIGNTDIDLVAIFEAALL